MIISSFLFKVFINTKKRRNYIQNYIFLSSNKTRICIYEMIENWHLGIACLLFKSLLTTQYFFSLKSSQSCCIRVRIYVYFLKEGCSYELNWLQYAPDIRENVEFRHKGLRFAVSCHIVNKRISMYRFFMELIFSFWIFRLILC